MGFPDTIERTLELTRPPADVWQALTTVEGLTSWFSERATIDLRAGGELRLSWPDHEPVMRIEQVDEPNVFAFTWPVDGNTTDALPRTYVEFRLVPNGSGTTLTVTESGFAQLPEGTYEKTYDAHSGGWTSELGELADHLAA